MPNSDVCSGAQVEPNSRARPTQTEKSALRCAVLSFGVYTRAAFAGHSYLQVNGHLTRW